MTIQLSTVVVGAVDGVVLVPLAPLEAFGVVDWLIPAKMISVALVLFDAPVNTILAVCAPVVGANLIHCSVVKSLASSFCSLVWVNVSVVFHVALTMFLLASVESLACVVSTKPKLE